MKKIAVVLIRGVNVRGTNLLSMPRLLSRMRSIAPPSVRWYSPIGISGNLLVSISHEGVMATAVDSVRKELDALGIREPITIRAIDELEASLQTYEKTLRRLGKTVNKRNSTIETRMGGNLKAGFAFVIEGEPRELVESEHLSGDVTILGACGRDIHFAWKRTDGSFGVPNQAIDKRFGVTGTSRSLSTVWTIVRKARKINFEHAAN